MRESELLAHIALRSQNLRDRFPHVLVGPGDDCAVVRTPNADQLLLTTDHLVERRHFEPIDLANKRYMLDLIARKAIARSISDIAAMGGTPMCSLATACLPPNFPQDAANELFDCVHKWAQHWNAPLVGGDISSFAPPSLPTHSRGAGVPPASPYPTSSSLVLTTAVLGTPHKSGAVLRSTAHAGDNVWVTGRLGASMIENRHLLFEPRLAEAAFLCDNFRSPRPLLHAMMDLSDGLGRDAARLGRASCLRLELDASLFPCQPGHWQRALADGEDYELLFTIDPEVGPHIALPPCGATTATPFTRIGSVVRAPGIGEPPDPPRPGLDKVPTTGCIVKTPDGSWIDASELGWEHT